MIMVMQQMGLRVPTEQHQKDMGRFCRFIFHGLNHDNCGPLEGCLYHFKDCLNSQGSRRGLVTSESKDRETPPAEVSSSVSNFHREKADLPAVWCGGALTVRATLRRCILTDGSRRRRSGLPDGRAWPSSFWTGFQAAPNSGRSWGDTKSSMRAHKGARRSLCSRDATGQYMPAAATAPGLLVGFIKDWALHDAEGKAEEELLESVLELLDELAIVEGEHVATFQSASSSLKKNPDPDVQMPYFFQSPQWLALH
ncbi:hypothetical protein MAPG_04193 [Magnaporthiopsis poae ATCC 64411]|uniref:Uncharacterized protein n=1 Tax=Magnaporthiopsis poae (strain ATCC 64411 / 73-15) TaxID=644358 RepID=A0A0C4DW25_MAGP6|nr:hypothetical protein MAPG_04193 [Magnaporthiopsis poae ATCC 64411]